MQYKKRCKKEGRINITHLVFKNLFELYLESLLQGNSNRKSLICDPQKKLLKMTSRTQKAYKELSSLKNGKKNLIYANCSVENFN